MALVALPHPQLARATEGELAPEAQADESEQLADDYEAQAQADAVDPAAAEPTLVAQADEDGAPEEGSAEAAIPAEEPALTAQADDFDGDIWLEGDDDVFSDGTLTMWLRQSGTIEDPYVIHVAVGSWPGEPDWDDLLNEGEAYTYDAETGKIVFDGAWLFDHGYDHAQVSVSLAYEPADAPDDWDFIDSEDRWIDVREAREEYDREWDRDVLPGWTVDVRKFYHVHVEDTAHPESFDGDYEVTDVEIISQRSDEGDVDVFTLEDTDGGWHYRAKTKGEATFKVTYLDIDGHEQSYEFTCNVTGRTFGLDVWAKGSATCIPGEQIELRAQAIDYREGEDDDFEGFSYTWEIADQDTGIIPMPPAVQYPEENKVIIGTNNLQNGTYGDGYSERHFRVVVKAYKDGYETERDFWISVVTQYPEIWFRELNDVNLPAYLPLGESITVTPEIHYFDVTKDNNYSVITSGMIKSMVWNYDENCLSITDKNGNNVPSGSEVPESIDNYTPFTIKRIGDWDTDLGLDVNWIPSSDQMPEFADEWGQRHEHGNYSFERVDPDIWFDGDLPDTLLVRDGIDTLTLPLSSNNISDSMSLEWTVGLWEDDQWVDRFVEGTDYTLNGNEITLDGRAILTHLPAGGNHQLDVRVAVEARIGDEVIRECDRWVRILEPYEDYDRERDRDMLPGWDGTIDGDYEVYVQDEAHPDGESFRYEVTDVQVVAGEELLSDFHPDSNGNGHWWYYRAGSFGTVTFKVTYRKLDGTTDSYTFDLHIGDVVYDLHINANPGVDNVLPGSRVDVWAKGTKQTAVKHDYDDDYDYEETDEGLDYVWELEQGGDITQMRVDPADPGHITLIIADIPEGQDDLDRFILARVRLYDGGDMVRRSGWAFDVRSDFTEPYVEGFDPNLPLGWSLDVGVDLRHYVYGQANYTPIDDAQFYFWYDPNCVSITGPNGPVDSDGNASQPAGTYTITRKGDWDTDIDLRAIWYEHGEEREYYTSRRLERLDCDLWFDDAKHDIDLWATRNEDGSFSDISPDVTNALFLSDDLAEIDGLAINWTVGTWENDEWDQVFGPESGLYTIGADGKSITSNAAAMAEQGVRNLRVTASARLGDVERETHNDFWFHLRERQTEIEREWDTDMLPGDVSTVNRWYHYRFEDEEFPEGIDGDYEVTNVTTSDPAIVSVRLSEWGEGDQADHNWRYMAEDMGTATLTVFYQLPDGTEDSYTFDVHVAGDVYFVDIWSDDGAYNVLPGSTVELHAQGTHRRQGQPDTDEGLTYSWGIVEGGDICSLVVDPNDPQHATVTVMTPAEAGKMGFDDNVTVRVCLHDGADEVARNDWECWVTNRFQGVYPTTIDRMLRIGQSEQVNLEVREYQYGRDDFTTIDGAEFAFHFDGDCVSIADASGNKVANSDETPDEVFYPAGTYTITRKGVWETSIGVNARWTEGNDQRFCFQRWLLDRPNYEMAFGALEYQANENCAAAIKLDVSNVSDVPGYADNLHLNIGTGWDDAQQAFAHEFAESEYSLDKADDVWTITVPGTVLKQKLSDWGCDSLDVFALLVMEGEYSLWTGAETSVTTTTANTHAISHVDAVAPHDGENGVAEHWRCDNCGATFADAAGTQPVSADDLVVEPAEQTITASDKVVAFGGTIALGAKASGGGALSYKSSDTGIATVNANGVVTPVKVGKVNITITAAAAGTYKAASKTITVTINKGTNPMVAKAKAKSFQASKTKKTTIKKTKAFTITGAQGKVTFKKVKGDKKITVSKTGKITIKKGLTKKTYKVKIQVTAAGNANYNPVTKTITVKIKMK